MINIVFIILFECFSGFAFHPLHISVTNVENDTINNQLEISVKLFKNDFHIALNQNYNYSIDFENCILTKPDSIIINKYIDTHFSTKFVKETNTNKMKLTGIKCNEDSIWLSFYFKYNKKNKKIELKNTFLLDLYADQNNLMIIKNKNEEKGYQLNKKSTVLTISL